MEGLTVGEKTRPAMIQPKARPHTVLTSVAFFESVMKGRVARAVEDLDDDTLRAIAESAVSSEHDGSNIVPRSE
jgi:hypothetical protein